MVILYFTGILVGILMALLMRGTMFKGEAVPFVMELPNYRMPGAKNVAQLLWEKAKDFLQRAFTVIFVATIIIWFLQTFDLRFNIVSDSKDSILAVVAGWIAPIFAPLGFGDWAHLYGAHHGLYGKGKRGVYLDGAVRLLHGAYNAADAAFRRKLLVFCLLYTPCVRPLHP